MSFIINQNFDLKSPQFNFARDYYKDIATLKAESEDNFPDHFITNVGGNLYRLNKSATVNATTGRWELLQISVSDFYDLVATINLSVQGNSIIVAHDGTPLNGVEIPTADGKKAGLVSVDFYNAIKEAISKGDTTASDLENLGSAYKTTKGQVETNTADIAAIKGQIGNISGDISNYLTIERFNTATKTAYFGDGESKAKVALHLVGSDDTVTNIAEIPEVSDTRDGVMTPAQKKKLDGIAEGANKTVVDSALSDTSTNPVQNKIVNAGIEAAKTAAGNAQTTANDAVTAAGKAQTTATTAANKLVNITDTIQVCDNDTIDSIFDGTYGK